MKILLCLGVEQPAQQGQDQADACWCHVLDVRIRNGGRASLPVMCLAPNWARGDAAAGSRGGALWRPQQAVVHMRQPPTAPPAMPPIIAMLVLSSPEGAEGGWEGGGA